ncbi:unnamed protein product [Rotaria sordida]|uniref:Uncharacterized protein n=1 Tax=Rotaria sordida TaxID=392033 RepID=A0A813YEU3_9BILA|nr:unnamed protein product [Rotaria sordida]CAF0888181.1 unnamed protein product [Rotaria sordida]
MGQQTSSVWKYMQKVEDLYIYEPTSLTDLLVILQHFHQLQTLTIDSKNQLENFAVTSPTQSIVLNIKDLWTKRDELQRQILIEEENKHKFENAIRLSSEKLPKINENLAKNNYAKNRI